jgi:hypothetical protein
VRDAGGEGEGECIQDVSSKAYRERAYVSRIWLDSSRST